MVIESGSGSSEAKKAASGAKFKEFTLSIIQVQGWHSRKSGSDASLNSMP